MLVTNTSADSCRWTQDLSWSSFGEKPERVIRSESRRAKKNSGRMWSQWEAGCGFDYTNPSAHIFTLFLKRKHVFSPFSARKPQRSSRSVFDCCTHLIRLIRFFSAETWVWQDTTLTLCTLLIDGWEWDFIFSRQVAHHALALSQTHTHHTHIPNGSN